MKKKRILKYLNKWTYRLGLRWWEIDAHFCKKCKANKKTFVIRGENREITTVSARIFSDWRYNTINIYFYLPALKGMSEDKIESVVLHELCHALVNEMREKGIDHEERVVTGLTKAFMWTEQFTK